MSYNLQNITDDPYHGVIVCKWVLDKYPVLERLTQAGLKLTRQLYDCFDDPGYVLVSFGNEISLAYLQAAVRAFSQIENAYIVAMGPDPQFQGAILVGYQVGEKQAAARLSDVAEAILSVDRDEIMGVDELAPIRDIVRAHAKKSGH